MNRKVPLISEVLSILEQEVTRIIENTDWGSGWSEKQSMRTELHVFLSRLELLRRALQAHDEEEIAYFAMDVGRFTAQTDNWRLIQKHMREARASKKSSDVSERNKSWIDESMRVWERKPTLSASRCAAHVHQKLKVKSSVRTIRQVIGSYAPKKQKVGSSIRDRQK